MASDAPGQGLSALPPDVAIAAELIDGCDLEHWAARLDGVHMARPRLHEQTYERLEDLQSWLAPRQDGTPSFVRAAVQNFARVLDDFLIVFNYELDARTNHLQLRRWYHRGIGGSGTWQEVERFETHELLIRNLAAELARAINLVITRVRQAVPGAFEDVPLATVDTAAGHAPHQAPRYSLAEQDEPQPYPGLREFPGAIPSRDVGALGVRGNDPRSPQDFVAWIDELLRRLGSASHGPPPKTRPEYLALPAPPTAPGDVSYSPPSGPAPALTGRLAAVWAVPVAISVLAALVTTPWMIGLGVSGMIAAALLHRQLAERPLRPKPVVVVTLVMLVGALTALVIESLVRGPNGSWRDRAGQACVAQYDRLQAPSTGGKREIITSLWHAHQQWAADLGAIHPPGALELQWRPIVNSVRDMTELWGMAANVEGSDPSGTLQYYATAFADDRRWLRESAKTLHIAACADSALHHEERSRVMLFTD